MESFLIAEKFVPKKELILVSKAILKAQDIREESWCHEKRRYSKKNIASAKEACELFKLDDVWAPIISSWNSFKWNAAQYWAENIIKMESN